MDCAQWRVVEMTPAYAEQISRWQYEGIYAFYDHCPEDMDEFMDGTHHACVVPDGALIGYYCFGGDARIPTVEQDPYAGEYLDVGLGLRPDLCGKKLGEPFVRVGLRFAEMAFDPPAFRLTVAAFNQRAIRLYERIGFRPVCEVTNLRHKNRFHIMTCNGNQGYSDRLKETQ